MVAATLSPGFELVSKVGGTTSVTGRDEVLAGLRRQGEAGRAIMWIELDDLVVDKALAGHGLLRTHKQQADAAPSVTTVPFAFFVRFDGYLMASETLYMDLGATQVREAIPLPSRAELLELVGAS